MEGRLWAREMGGKRKWSLWERGDTSSMLLRITVFTHGNLQLCWHSNGTLSITIEDIVAFNMLDCCLLALFHPGIMKGALKWRIKYEFKIQNPEINVLRNFHKHSEVPNFDTEHCAAWFCPRHLKAGVEFKQPEAEKRRSYCRLIPKPQKTF